LFGEEENAPANAIIFSTVHKAKGLEFKRVWMFESTFRTHTTEGQNLYYVAATRAMESLYLVQLPTKNGKPPFSAAAMWATQQEDE
jgi:superfamily I DNA/RNA helicase